jgi:hypothetical protein
LENIFFSITARSFRSSSSWGSCRCFGPGAQHEVDHLVAEVLGVADAGRLLDLLELVVEGVAVEDLAGVRVAVFLVLDPEVGVGHVAVEDVLAVFAVALEVGGLDLLADELGVARGEELLDEGQVAGFVFGRILLLGDLLLQHIHQVHRVGGHFAVVEVEHLGEHLEGKAGGQAGHALVDAGVVAVFLVALGLRVGVLEVFAVVDRILEKRLEFSGSLTRDSTANWAIILRVSGAQGACDSELLASSFS